MNVIFTSSIFFLQKKGGISRYFVNLSKQLNILKIKSKIIAPLSKNIYLDDLKEKKVLFYLNKIPNNYLTKKINDFLFNFFLKKENVDIIHETYYNKNNFDTLKNKLKIITVYDFIHEKFSQNYEKKKLLEKKNIFNHVDHFICISKKTQKDLLKYYKVPLKKTTVIYLGCDHLKKKDVANINIDLPKIFFLYVGSRDGYKNFSLLADALNSSNYFNKIKVVCFGGGKFSHKEIKKNKLNNNFINIQGDDNMLTYLYTKALALVNTSRYEGFGITNIEAMHLGCPVISSNFTTMQEVGNNSCLFFKNGNQNDLAKKIKFILLNKNFRKTLIKKGYKRSKMFTWASCARDTKKLYSSLLKRN